jgi:TolB-like protein
MILEPLAAATLFYNKERSRKWRNYGTKRGKLFVINGSIFR